MASLLRFPLALSMLLAATACATPDNSAGTPSASAPVAADTAPAPEEEPAMTCQADKGQWAIGQIADEALLAKVKTDTTSDRVRVIRPGMAVTMDYREDRVNLDVDADNRVTAVRCT